MQFYSSSAYRELRKFFGNNLPTTGTLKKWMRVVDNSPGITQISLDMISEKAALYKAEGKQLQISLISDEIGIRKQPLWNQSNLHYDGFDENANSVNQKKRQKSAQNDGAKTPLAKDALVFMAVGDDFRVTVAYQFLNGLDTIDRALLTREVISSVDNTGAKVVSLTSDGLAANLAVAKQLGADFENNKPYINRPSCPNEKIFIILDPPHMMKLLRKYLSEKKLMYGNEELKWETLSALADLQDSDNFSISSKLTKKHINWQDHKMNVKKAVQIFSNSNADAIEQLCQDRYEQFIGTEKLAEFLRLTNNLYDVMNFAEGDVPDGNFKLPINSSTIEKIRKLFDSFKLFVSKMTFEVKRKKTVKREPVLNLMGFAGLLINIESTIGIWEHYAQNGDKREFCTFKYSQDHLEQYFSLVRSSLGCNYNPNVHQFMSAYRKLLFCTPFLSSIVKTNCFVEFPQQLLEVSSQASSIPQHLIQRNTVLQAREIEIEADFNTFINIELEPYDKHKFALQASMVEAEIKKKYKAQTASACQDCLSIFGENLRMFDELVAKKLERGDIAAQPCFSTMHIILACEGVNDLLQSNAQIDYINVAKTIITQCLDIDFLFETSQFESHSKNRIENCPFSHKENFILDVVMTFLHMKSKEMCAKITLEEQEEQRKRRKQRRNRINQGR